MPSRHLAWPHCYNARDLGGLPTRHGTETRWRSVMRSDLLSRLTAEGRQALLDYGARTIVDLRAPEETAQKPSPVIQSQGLRVHYLNRPLEAYLPHVSALISRAETRGEVYAIILDHYPDEMAAAMRAMAAAQPGGIVIHCHSGKDRTGMVSALLLSLAGVPADAIAADYAESQVRLWPLYEQALAEVREGEAVDFWLRPTATADTMHWFLEHVERRHGGAEAYLLASGLSASEIEALKRRLLGA